MRLGALGEEGGKSVGGCSVVMVIAGDKDFMPELTRLCNAGYYVILIHRNNITNTRVIKFQ